MLGMWIVGAGIVALTAMCGTADTEEQEIRDITDTVGNWDSEFIESYWEKRMLKTKGD